MKAFIIVFILIICIKVKSMSFGAKLAQCTFWLHNGCLVRRPCVSYLTSIIPVSSFVKWSVAFTYRDIRSLK